MIKIKPLYRLQKLAVKHLLRLNIFMPPHKEKTFDVIVLGGGSGGYAAARSARQHVDRVAIVDGAAQLGGLCILRGCMPSKTMIYSAEVLHLAREGARFGLRIPAAAADMAAIQARKKKLIADFASYRESQLTSERFSLFRAHGRFLDEHRVELSSGEVLRAPRIIVATGSEVNWPLVAGLSRETAITSDEVLELDSLPESVIVLGGGVVACELAQFLRRAGSKVTLLQRSPRLLRDATPEAAAAVREAFEAEGMTVHTGAVVEAIERRRGYVRVKFLADFMPREIDAAVLVNALGRRPATAELGLDRAGVTVLNTGHIAADYHQRSNVPHIYAVGDCAGPHEIVHIAVLQGECAGNHAGGAKVKPMNYDRLLKVVFTDPQVAFVGLSEEDLAERGIETVSAQYPFNDHGKSVLMEATRGFVRLWAEKKDGRIVAAECVGKDGGELIHAMSVAVSMGATARKLLETEWYHPTLSEIWTYPLEEIEELRGRR
jgi:pyruvate/2-oxoglutarate dehydrogenase complex dihydrolipoamide dehydrogenase (E3) component